MDYTLIRENFEKHGFSTQLFGTSKEAVSYLTETLKQQTIGFGGSVTLKEMGLYEALQKQNVVVWHNAVAALAVRKLANCANVYITSANAVTQTGEIVNIDGTGNRVAMTAFGPEVCYYVIGRNKITANVEAAYQRCKHVAAPKNAQRLNLKLPCAVKGDKCYDCNSPGRICRMTMIIDRVPLGMKGEIVFVDEVLGF